MSKDTCDYCGRPVTPCANCGSTEGHMVEMHGAWFHERQVDCIVHLNSELKKALGRVTELESFLSAYAIDPQEQPSGVVVLAATPAPQEPTP